MMKTLTRLQKTVANDCPAPLALTARDRVLTVEEVRRNLLRELAAMPVIRRK